ncbi:OmpP1/FadL family transporter [Sulfurimonas sp.]|uniref:OmpP1/FadL family transporter n=1 Tax=Sulfurimonas sp. TaxID=2022749 RepID=UPI003D0A7F1C
MKKQILKYTLLSLAASSTLLASGYKIPENSMNAVGLCAANIAHAKGADAAYYNPANMVFMENKNYVEVATTYIGLDATKFTGSGAYSGIDIDAHSEKFLIPSLHYVSEDINGYRIGFDIVVPAGLTKRWDDAPAVYSAKKFSLEVVELNPSVAMKLTDDIAFAAGVRAVYSSGIVQSEYTASRDLQGDSMDFGYNLALSYKPTSKIDVALTYRSNINLTVSGNAKLDVSGTRVYDGGGNVMVPLPASASLAAAYTFDTKTTVEVVIERNFWSAYDELDFDYASAIPAILVSSFDDPIAKNWKDVNAYRVGVTQELDSMTLMAGFVYDQNPVPDDKVTFELPDSDSMAISFGIRYPVNQDLDVGLSAIYSMHEDRDVSNSTMVGTISNSNITLVSVGLGYKF